MIQHQIFLNNIATLENDLRTLSRIKSIKHAIRNKKTSFNKYKRPKRIQDFID